MTKAIGQIVVTLTIVVLAVAVIWPTAWPDLFAWATRP